MAEYKYRCVEVVTYDYGDGPAAGGFAEAVLSVLPDGSFWRDRPATLKIGVPLGTRPGTVYRVVIEPVL